MHTATSRAASRVASSLLLLLSFFVASTATAERDTAAADPYAGFAAFRGSKVPPGALPVARFAPQRDDFAFLLPTSSSGAPEPPAGARRLPGEGPWPTGRLLVELSGAGALEPAARELAKNLDVSFERSLRVGRWVLLDANDPTLVRQILNQLVSAREVVRAEPELLRRLDLRSPFDDALFPLQWHLENTRQRDLPRMQVGADIHARAAWQITTGDPDVIIAVLDTGLDLGHPEFADEGKIVAPFNTTDLSADPAPPANELNSAHGVACAGLAAASQSGTTGVVGVCPDCSVMPIRMLAGYGYTTDTAVVDAFVHARDEGAAVASCSWGFFGTYPPRAALAALASFVEEGRGGLGAVALFAAGNTGSEAFPHDVSLEPRVLAIGGTGADDERAAYSSYGPGLDVMAPTGHRFEDETGEPLLLAPMLVTSDRPGADGYNPALDVDHDPGTVLDTDYTAVMDGTSGATPIAAGLAGLVLSMRPELRYEQVHALLREHAAQVGDVVYDERGFNPYYGHGRIDAAATLLAASTGNVCLPDAEACDDGVDNDCDGHVDDEDEDCGFELPEMDLNVGAPCSEGCGLGYCWSAVSDGVCSVSCSAGGCPEGALCIETRSGPFYEPKCMQTCDDDGDCRGGSTCLATAEGGVCHVVCGLDETSGCPAGFRCQAPGEPCVPDDSAPPADGGEPDAGDVDAGGSDAGTSDAGTGSPDGGDPDAGTSDAGKPDAGDVETPPEGCGCESARGEGAGSAVLLWGLVGVAVLRRRRVERPST